MLIRFLTCSVGPDRFILPGQVVHVPDDEAARQIANGNAVAVFEQAAQPPPEQAVAPRPPNTTSPPSEQAVSVKTPRRRGGTK